MSGTGTITCKFCNKCFVNKSNLTKHQKTSKFCIKQQHEQNVTTTAKFFSCEFCNKQVTSHQNLKYHMNICKQKPPNQEVIELKKICESLHKTVGELKETQKVIINNNNTNNTNNNNITINIDFLSYMTPEKIQDTFKNHYDFETLLKAQEGLAQFTVKNFLLGDDKPIYLCTDKQRKNFCFFDDENNKILDNDAKILSSLMINNALDCIKSIHYGNKYDMNEDANKAYQNILEMRQNKKKYVTQLADALPSNLKEREIINEFVDKSPTDNRLLHNMEDMEKNLNFVFTPYHSRRLEEAKEIYKKNDIMVIPPELAALPNIRNELRKFYLSP